MKKKEEKEKKIMKTQKGKVWQLLVRERKREWQMSLDWAAFIPGRETKQLIYGRNFIERCSSGLLLIEYVCKRVQ